jgi:hypothetical protein
MDAFIWIILFAVIVGAVGLQARQREEELLKHIPKKKREEIIKQRTKDAKKQQEKNMKDMWIVLGVLLAITVLFILGLIALAS